MNSMKSCSAYKVGFLDGRSALTFLRQKDKLF